MGLVRRVRAFGSAAVPSTRQEPFMRSFFRFARRTASSPPPDLGPYRTPQKPATDEAAPTTAWARSRPRWRWLAAVVALVPVALVFATRGTDSPPVAAIEASVPDVAVAPPSATVVAPPPCPEETYLARLADGRKALGKKKLADAREALNLALDCRADDAAALSERGYSWYLSGEMGNANEDLALASRKTLSLIHISEPTRPY